MSAAAYAVACDLPTAGGLTSRATFSPTRRQRRACSSALWQTEKTWCTVRGASGRLSATAPFLSRFWTLPPLWRSRPRPASISTGGELFERDRPELAHQHCGMALVSVDCYWRQFRAVAQSRQPGLEVGTEATPVRVAHAFALDLGCLTRGERFCVLCVFEVFRALLALPRRAWHGPPRLIDRRSGLGLEFASRRHG